jgi:hypothetical protein
MYEAALMGASIRSGCLVGIPALAKPSFVAKCAGKGGAMNWGFITFQQCLATVGQAGLCIQNSTHQTVVRTTTADQGPCAPTDGR